MIIFAIAVVASLCLAPPQGAHGTHSPVSHLGIASVLPSEYTEGFSYALGSCAAGEYAVVAANTRTPPTFRGPWPAAFLIGLSDGHPEIGWRYVYRGEELSESVELFGVAEGPTLVLLATHGLHASVSVDHLHLYRHECDERRLRPLLQIEYMDGGYIVLGRELADWPGLLVYEPSYGPEGRYGPQRFRFRCYAPTQTGGYRLASSLTSTRQYDSGREAYSEVQAALRRCFPYALPESLPPE